MLSHCLACQSQQLNQLIDFGKLPASSQSLYSKYFEAKTVPFRLSVCDECTHMQNDLFTTNEDNHYGDNYLFSVGHSDAAKKLQSSIATQITSKIQFNNEDTIIEVGCGDAFFLSHFTQTNAQCVGYEPSASFSMANKYTDIKVHNKYFDPAQDKIAPKLLIFRHVVEHLTDPYAFLKSLNADFLYIEVPRSDHLIKHKMYSDFYNDHISYFSLNSLSKMLEKLSYNVIDTTLAGEGEFLGILAKKEEKCDFNIPCEKIKSWTHQVKEFATNWESYKNEIKQLLDSHLSLNEQVTVWGAGSRGATLLYHLGLQEKVKAIIDSDINKSNRFIPGYKNPITKTSDFLNNAQGTVIITSATFSEEIKDNIKKNAKIAKELKIITLYPPHIETMTANTHE